MYRGLILICNEVKLAMSCMSHHLCWLRMVDACVTTDSVCLSPDLILLPLLLI